MQSIRTHLRGQSILLTGSTGFLAKAFLEKLLRTVPDIGRIYLLVRASDLQHSVERGETDVFSSSIFDHLKSKGGFEESVRAKVRLVSGDTSRTRLGLSAKDYLTLINEVNLVVNAAASTDFLNKLDSAITTNMLSTWHLSRFVEDSMIARLLHVSTCYVNEFANGTVEEKIYSQPAASKRLPVCASGELNLDQIIDEMQVRVDKIHARHAGKPNKLASELSDCAWRLSRAHGWNNIYTFTKWLGENVLAQAADKIHCSIVRPSIIESCALPPHEGWIEGWKVGDPIIYAVGTGSLKIFPARNDSVIDIVPVDIVVNAMFTAIPELMSREQPKLEIYQACSSSENPLRVEDVTRIVRSAFEIDKTTPPPRLMPPALWKGLSAVTRTLIPSGSGSRLGKFLQLAYVYAPYTCTNLIFDNSNLRRMHARLCPDDQKEYAVSCQFDWSRYLGGIHISGMFKHLLRRPAPAEALRKAQ